MCAPFRPGRTSSSQGIGGHFIPPSADYFYLDSYQTSEIVPASQSPSVRHFISELDAKGKRFNGFGEYGRGVSTSWAPIKWTTIQARIKVFAEDSAWLRSRAGVRVWSYWYTTDNSGGQWRMTDAASQDAWARVAAQ